MSRYDDPCKDLSSNPATLDVVGFATSSILEGQTYSMIKFFFYFSFFPLFCLIAARETKWQREPDQRSLKSAGQFSSPAPC